MTEQSFGWDGTTLGDATLAEYSSKEFFHDWFKFVLLYNGNMGVVDTGFSGYTGGLQVSAGSGVVTVETGFAIVNGRMYKNDAQLTLTPDNTASQRADRVVLRSDFAAQTIRAVILKGTDGSLTPPAVNQDDTRWEISLATFTLTAGPTIGTVTRDAIAVRTPLGPGYQISKLASDDVLFSVGWNSIGSGVSITLGPGKWVVWAGASGRILATAGARQIRIFNTSSSTTLSSAITNPVVNDNWNMAVPPYDVELSSTQTLELQYNALATNDIVFSQATSIYAQRVI